METGQEVAIKLEPVKSKHPQLFYESKLYQIFKGGGLTRGEGWARWRVLVLNTPHCLRLGRLQTSVVVQDKNTE